MSIRGVVYALVALVIGVSSITAEAATWIRGVANIGAGQRIDPLIELFPPNFVPTISTAEFNDAQKSVFSQADLGNGALRGRAAINGGSGNASVNPVIGETVEFFNDTGAESFWDFELALEGSVLIGDPGFPVTQDFGAAGIFRTTFIQFAVHIFDGNTVGPNGSANSWVDQLGSSLFSVVANIEGFPLEGTVEGLDEFLSDSIAGSLVLAPGLNTFDVVTVLAVGGSIPGNFDSSFDLDFSSTAAFSIDSPVNFTSASGLFLTGENNLPEPASTALVLMALAGVACWRRSNAA